MSGRDQARAARAILSRLSGNATVDLTSTRVGVTAWERRSARPVSLRCVQARQRPQSSGGPLGWGLLLWRFLDSAERSVEKQRAARPRAGLPVQTGGAAAPCALVVTNAVGGR